MKVLVLTNSINGLYNFRRELILNLLDEGYKVVVAAPKGEKTIYFAQIGCECIETIISRRGTNPIADIKLLMSYSGILKAIKPNIVLTYTIKPNVYGGLVCRLKKVPYIANITGLGTSIENEGLLQKVSLLLYKIGLKNARCVFFQNETNMQFFSENKIVKRKMRLIPGSGVNLDNHSFEEYPNEDEIVKFLFIGRMMKAKGIDELLKAVKKVKERYNNVQFDFVGSCEENYKEMLKELDENKVLKYHGQQNDVHYFIKNSNATINPSHHEGMSNVLLETASTGRPIIAANIPGCREIFDEDVSGLGFEVRSVEGLVKSLIKFIELPYEEKKKMGIAGRRKMEKEFDRNIVINAYMDEINKVLEK